MDNFVRTGVFWLGRQRKSQKYKDKNEFLEKEIMQSGIGSITSCLIGQS